MKSKKNLIVASIAGVAVVAIGAAVAVAALRPPPAPQYVTAPVKVGDVEDAVLATGALQPFTVINVGSQASGQVLSVTVKLGDRVTPGQLRPPSIRPIRRTRSATRKPSSTSNAASSTTPRPTSRCRNPTCRVSSS